MNHKQLKSELIKLSRSLSYNEEERLVKKFYEPNFIDLICEAFGVSKDDLIGKSRDVDLVAIRYGLFTYLRRVTPFGLTKIGSFFNKDHTTVIHGLKKFKDLTDINDYTYLNILDKIEETLNVKIK